MKKVFDARSNYDNIFFLDDSKFASQQLKYFIDSKCQEKVKQKINTSFSANDKYNKYYSITDDKTKVINCTTCNLTAIRYIKEISIAKGEEIKVICFGFQMQYLQDYFGIGDNIEYYEMSTEKIFDTEDTR